jgi:peptidoglycan/xylan/chitin deacetylase (PgdA/CDA1 family)
MISVRSAVKQGALSAIALAGVHRWLLRRAAGKLGVLCLHGVSPGKNPYNAPLHPRHLDELLRFLNRHAYVRGLRDEPVKRRDRPEIVVSFDDGYRNFVDDAMPILKKYRVRANQNIIPASVESGRPSWEVELGDVMVVAPLEKLARIALPGLSLRREARSDDQKARFANQLVIFLRRRTAEERVPLLAEVRQTLATVEYTPTKMMTRGDVIACAREHDIGAHSWSHEAMEWQSQTFFDEDTDRCAEYFDKSLGLAMDIYSFPGGSYRAWHIERLRANGVKHVLLVETQWVDGAGDTYARLPIAATSRAETMLQAVGFRSRGTMHRSAAAPPSPQSRA